MQKLKFMESKSLGQGLRSGTSKSWVSLSSPETVAERSQLSFLACVTRPPTEGPLWREPNPAATVILSVRIPWWLMYFCKRETAKPYFRFPRLCLLSPKSLFIRRLCPTKGQPCLLFTHTSLQRDAQSTHLLFCTRSLLEKNTLINCLSSQGLVLLQALSFTS